MTRNWKLALASLCVLGLLAAGCNKGSGPSLTDKERSVVWQRLKAVEPISPVHEGDAKLLAASSGVFNEFKRATGHTIDTVEVQRMQDILDLQALQSLDIFGGSSTERPPALTRAKGMLINSVKAEDENRYTARIEQKWVITGSVRIVDMSRNVIYGSPTIKAGGEKTLQEAIEDYVNEMGKRLRADLGD
jgi:hypothetical protein